MEPTEEAVSAVKIEIEEVELKGQEQEQKRVICKYCQKDYSLRSIRGHVKTQHPNDGKGEKVWKCDKDGKPKWVSETKNCPVCHKEISKKSLKVHMRLHTGERPFQCDKCEKTFVQKPHLRVHLKAHAKENNRLGYKSASFLRRVATGEDPKEEALLICPICGKVVKKCLDEHMKTHYGHRPYECDQCDKCFKQSGQLSSHITQVHTINMLTCDHCQKQFNGKKALISHMQSHIDVDQRRHRCQFCQKTFATNGIKRDHERIHTGEKPFKCDQCSQSFRTREYLASHVLTHTLGDKPYKCAVCDRAFRDPQNCRAHMKSQHGGHEKNLLCPICSAPFKMEVNRRSHMMQVHRSCYWREKEPEPVEEQMKKCSINLRKLTYIDYAAKRGCKSMILYPSSSGRKPMYLM